MANQDLKSRTSILSIDLWTNPPNESKISTPRDRQSNNKKIILRGNPEVCLHPESRASQAPQQAYLNRTPAWYSKYTCRNQAGRQAQTIQNSIQNSHDQQCQNDLTTPATNILTSPSTAPDKTSSISRAVYQASANRTTIPPPSSPSPVYKVRNP